MNKKILLEILRYKKLMGINSENNILTESRLPSGTGLDLLMKIFITGTQKPKFADLFNSLKQTQSFKKLDDLYQESLGMRSPTFDKFRSNLDAVLRSRGQIARNFPNLIAAYDKLIDDLVSIIFTNNQFRELRRDIFLDYLDKSPNSTKNSVYQLIQLAENGNKKAFDEAYEVLLQSVDVNILNYTKLYFPVKPLIRDRELYYGKNFWRFLKGNTNVTSSTTLKEFWTGLKKTLSETWSEHQNKTVKETIDEMNRIVDKLYLDILANNINNYPAYFENLSVLLKKLNDYSEGTQQTARLAAIWQQFKKDLPSNSEVTKIFTKPDDTVDYIQFNDWIKFFNTGRDKNLLPKGYTTRFDAIKKILTKSPKEGWGKWNPLAYVSFTRVANLAFKMDARIKSERVLNRKLFGRAQYAGQTVGSYTLSLFVTSSLVSAFLKTIMDIIDRQFPEDLWIGEDSKLYDPNRPEGKLTQNLDLIGKAFMENFYNQFSFISLVQGETDFIEFLKQVAKSTIPGIYLPAIEFFERSRAAGEEKLNKEQINQIQQNLTIDTLAVFDQVKRDSISGQSSDVQNIINGFIEDAKRQYQDTVSNLQ
jgi:hypothetical protein